MKFDIQSVTPAQPAVQQWKYGQIWRGVEEIVIALGDAHWYGGGGLVHQQYPLEKIALYPATFITSDNGSTGLLGILEPLWWTSTGAGIRVESDSFEVSLNAPLSGEPPGHSFQDPAHNHMRPRLAGGIETDGLLRIRGDNLTLRFFDCDNPKQVVQAFWELITITPAPPDYLIERPLWTTWAHFKNDISHDAIIDYAQQLKANGFTGSVFGIDAKWQHQFGDTHFDLRKFPDPASTIRQLHDLGMETTLWCVPFFMEDSEHFQSANSRGYTLRNASGDTFIGTWWEGKAAFLDIASPDAMTWHLDNLEALARQVRLDSFKFDAGEAMFYMQPALNSPNGIAPNAATHHYVNQISQRFPWSDIRAGWRNQAAPMLFRQWDKSTRWGYDNGLASCVTQAITLNMLGYPINFPDMIGGNEYGDYRATAELMIRWTQAVAPMPIIQFSVPPWSLGETCTAICKQYHDLHRELAPRSLQLAARRQPIVRPLWWIAPDDEQALTVADQYLIGDDLLVAPVIEPGAESRDIYLPEGTWRNYWQPEQAFRGGQWITDFPAPLDVLPMFERDS